MRLEPLTRLIESADFLAFREIALRYLRLKGYRDVELKDGWNDGGSDFAVGTLGGNPDLLAIQVTVQRAGWQEKVRADCRRAKSELGLENAVYMTSRRLASTEFTKVADDLWEKDSISVRAVDSQGIASLFFEQGAERFVLESLGIPLDSRRPAPVPRPDLKEDAAYSFAFFGEASEKFRNSVVEQTVLSYLTRPDSDPSRGATESAVADGLQLHGDQAALATSAIDRMLQRQRLLINGELSVPESVVESFRTMRALRESQWQALAREVDARLVEAGLRGGSLERASEAVMEGAGSLFIAAATSASAAVGMAHDPSPIRMQLRGRLRAIAASLSAAGVSDRAIDTSLQDLARLVSNSEIGRTLMAGELFVSLASMRTNDFERAFGATGGSEIYLDASVAIPMVAGLLFEPASHRFSQAALRIYDLAKRRGIPVLLPRVYLEEAASHLIQAYDRYQPLLGTDDDLRYSTNAFVAHYSDLTLNGTLRSSFSQYASALGYTPSTRSFERQRDEVMDRMAGLFTRYAIEITDLSRPGQRALDYAQEAMTFTAHELRLSRTGRLLRHDAEVVAHFMDTNPEGNAVRLFCTWDRLHLRLQTEQGLARWQALDPAMLGDVLVLTRTDDAAALMTTVDVAMELSEEEGERGAAVLDTLVRIETEGFHDAELLRLARQFKDAYMQAMRDNAAPDDLAEAWAEWKGGSRELVRQPKSPLES